MSNWEALQPNILPLLTAYSGRLAGAILVLLLGWFIAGWLKRMILRGSEKAQLDATLARFLASAARWSFVLLAGLTALSALGVQTTNFAAVIGAAGLAIGLAFQGVLSNLASGLMLLVFRPFAVGDVVTLSGQTGQVDSIDLMSTCIDSFDNRRYIIPNSAVFGSTVENISHHPVRRVDVTVGTAYSADLKQTRTALEQCLAEIPDSLEEPAPAVILVGLGSSSVDWSVRVWAAAENIGSVKQATLAAVKRELDTAGIDIPFPQMEVHLEQNV